MSSVPSCPWSEGCQALLDGAIPPDQRERLERHLESCPACQSRLDRPEGCQEVLQRLDREVGDPTVAVVDPTLAQVLERLYEAKSPDRSPSVELVDLYFLSPADRPDLLGMLGDYEVQEVIGQGGMGVVLKAFEPALNRLVAIKVLSPALAGSATARRRFTREAQAAAAVCHDNIVAVHGVHEVAGLPYLVMQHVPGESVQDRLDRVGPLPLEEIVRIGLQTASGLAAAHAQGLIHRDVKPANLLLETPLPKAESVSHPSQKGAGLASRESLATVAPTPFCEGWLTDSASGTGPVRGVERVKITDFGLARMIDDVGLTQNGVVAGTPEYMAPEQAKGESIDHRADLFSLGSVLYALCTGQAPFRGSTTAAVLHKVSTADPQPVQNLNPDVPAWLDELIARLLAKEPGQRIQTAAEVQALLEGYLAHLRQPGVQAPVLPPGPLSPERQGAPEMISLTCRECGKALKVRAELAGKKVKCPGCGQATIAESGEGPVSLPQNPRRSAALNKWGLWCALAFVLLVFVGAILLRLSRPSRGLSRVNLPGWERQPLLGVDTVPGVEESGFYDTHANNNGRPSRWTNGHGRLVIPIDPETPPQALRVYFRLWRPQGHARPASLQILVNQRELFQGPISSRDAWERAFALGGIDLGKKLVLEIVSDTFLPNEGADPDHGVEVLGIELLARADEAKDQLSRFLGCKYLPELQESGFYGQQYNKMGQPFRLTNGHAKLVIPIDPTRKPQALWLHLWPWRPRKPGRPRCESWSTSVNCSTSRFLESTG